MELAEERAIQDSAIILSSPIISHELGVRTRGGFRKGCRCNSFTILAAHLKKCRSPGQEKCRKSASESAGPKPVSYTTSILLVFPGFCVQGMVLVNPFLLFTKTTDFFTKIPGLKGKGS